MQRIESLHNERVKYLLKLILDASFRKEKKEVVLEGNKLSKEIAEIKNDIIVFSVEKPSFSCRDWVPISSSVAKKLSQTENSEGVFALVSLPDESPLTQKQKIVVFDAVSDPGNLGTLLRTALALGWEGVYFLPGCCDPFNAKVLRASKGALFKMPFQIGTWENLKLIIQKNQLIPLAADLYGDFPEKYLNQSIALILGNEGLGISLETKKHSSPITIPIDSKIESLNVAIAGGILMYLLRKHPHG